MDSYTLSVGLPRNQPTYLRLCVRILMIVAGAVIAPTAYADTIELKPGLPAARLAQIESQMAPARFFTVTPFGKPIPTIRGRIIAVEPSPDHPQWILKVRAWWRAVPNERVTWSAGLVTLPRDAVRSITFEFDSLFGLRFALSDRGLTSPMGSEVWLRRMLQTFDPDGRLGLDPEGSTPESAREAASVKLEGGLLRSLRAISTVRELTSVELQAEDKRLANPLYWKRQNWGGLLAQSILYALAFDETLGGRIEPDYRQSANNALAFLSYLARANVREEFLFGKPNLTDPSRSEVPESERYAVGVQAVGHSTYAEISEAVRLGLLEEGEIMTGGAGTPAPAQIGMEPSEVAFAALKAIESVPALWLLQDSNEEFRRTHAVLFLDAISAVGAPPWVDSPLLPAARRSDRQQQFATDGRAQNFPPKPGMWSLLQVQARKTALSLLLPNYNDLFIRNMKAQDQLRASADVYQKVFCDYLALQAPSDGLAIEQFVERILIETKHEGRQLAIPCFDLMISKLTGAHSGDPTEEIYAQRRRQILPSLLIIGALFSGPDAVFPGNDLGKQFNKQMGVLLDGLRDGRANFTEWDLMSHVCAVGGYVNESRKDWNDVAAREALRQAVKAVRTIIANSDGDAAQVKVRELVEKRTPRVRPLPR